VAVVLLASPSAFAEDIGREPLASPDSGPGALTARGPAASQGATAVSPDAEPLSARGPALSSGRTFADQGPGQVVRRRSWYGWQPLLSDGVATLTLLAYASQNHSSSNETGWLAPITGIYVLGPPIIHLAHGHPGKALLSAAIRSVGPLMIAAAIDSESSFDDSHSPNPALIVFGLLSIPAAISIDAAAISREDAPRAGESSSFLRRVGFAPWVDTRRGAGGLVLDLPL
jgi:hypothetical protein